MLRLDRFKHQGEAHVTATQPLQGARENPEVKNKTSPAESNLDTKEELTGNSEMGCGGVVRNLL